MCTAYKVCKIEDSCPPWPACVEKAMLTFLLQGSEQFIGNWLSTSECHHYCANKMHVTGVQRQIQRGFLGAQAPLPPPPLSQDNIQVSVPGHLDEQLALAPPSSQKTLI